MKRDNIIRVRLSDVELQALKKFVESRDVSMSEAVRDWVKTLIPQKEQSENQD